jgi:hypothetical protein
MTNPNPSPEAIYDAALCAEHLATGMHSPGFARRAALRAMSVLSPQTPPAPSLSTDVQSAATGFHEHDVSLQVAMPAPGEVEARFWLIVHEPGKVPDRKGSWPRSQLPQIMREFIAARPNAYLTVLTVGADGSPDVQHGPEALQMADGRSMRTGSTHNARTLAAHTEALATVAAGDDEGVARGVEAAAKVAESWIDPAFATAHENRIARSIAAAIRLLPQGEGK